MGKPQEPNSTPCNVLRKLIRPLGQLTLICLSQIQLDVALPQCVIIDHLR